MSKANLFYAQSGGVTSVINASACGVIETARRHRDRIGKVYAGRNGIVGALNEELIDTGRESTAAIAARRLRFLSLQTQVLRREPARIRAADGGLQSP